jgi:RNA polymerase sigma-70 factor (sigma-E family)
MALTNDRDEQFRSYVLASRGKLVRTATFLASGDPHAAEDLVQTALMRLYVAWSRVRPESIDAYARKAMVNGLIDNRRRGFARLERSQPVLPDIAVEDVRPSDTDTVVFIALAALPPRMRAAVVLRHLLELSVAETADILNCSEGTVKSQTARGLDQLRAALAPAVLSPASRPDQHHTGLPTDPFGSVDLQHADATVSTISRGQS